MDTESTTSVFVFRGLLDTIAELGMEPTVILEQAGIAPEDLTDVDGRVPTIHLARLWNAVERSSGDPGVGIHIAERISLRGFGIFQYLAQHSENLGDAFKRVCRFWRLLTSGADVEYWTSSDRARFVHRAPVGISCTGRNQEYSLACVMIYGRRGTGIDWNPIHVRFPHPRPPDISKHEDIFRAPIEFDAPVAELVFDRELADLPMVAPDEKLMAILDRHTANLMKQIPGLPVSRKARDVIRRLTPTEAPTLEGTSKRLGLGVRTLQRQLSREGTSHRKLVEEVRQELAMSFLRKHQIPITKVSQLLGFSEPSAFYRAFRRWTGTTPLKYRDG